MLILLKWFWLCWVDNYEKNTMGVKKSTQVIEIRKDNVSWRKPDCDKEREESMKRNNIEKYAQTQLMAEILSFSSSFWYNYVQKSRCLWNVEWCVCERGEKSFSCQFKLNWEKFGVEKQVNEE